LGVAEVLDAVEAAPGAIRGAVATVLADRRYRASAERVREEIAAMPDPEYAVKLLERLASESAPISRRSHT
jgi:UDP:flavonoid glycosyltransferase YjiC (YdhE family)